MYPQTNRGVPGVFPLAGPGRPVLLLAAPRQPVPPPPADHQSAGPSRHPEGDSFREFSFFLLLALFCLRLFGVGFPSVKCWVSSEEFAVLSDKLVYLFFSRAPRACDAWGFLRPLAKACGRLLRRAKPRCLAGPNRAEPNRTELPWKLVDLEARIVHSPIRSDTPLSRLPGVFPVEGSVGGRDVRRTKDEGAPRLGECLQP